MNEGLMAVDTVLEAEARLLFAGGGQLSSSQLPGGSGNPLTFKSSLTQGQNNDEKNSGFPLALKAVHDSVTLEVEIRSSIKLREEYLARLLELCGPDVSSIDLQKNLLDIIGVMDLLRSITVEIVESITRWRRGLPRPFPWQGPSATKKSYLMKISEDTKFLAEHPALESWLGMTLAHNPFFSLNNKCRKEQHDNESKSGKEPRASRKLLLASFHEDRLQAVEDAVRREEIHNGMVHRGEIGGMPVDILGGIDEDNESSENDVTKPEREEIDDLIAMESRLFFNNAALKNSTDNETPGSFSNDTDASAHVPATEVLLADRVRRKLEVISKRPKLRAKLVRLAQTSEQQLKAGQRRKKGMGASLRIGKRFRGSKPSKYSIGRSLASNSGGEGRSSGHSGGGKLSAQGGLGQEELRQLLFRNAGTKFDTVEWKWLMGRLDPKRTGRVWAEDLVALVELAPKGVNLFYFDADEDEKREKALKETERRRKAKHEKKGTDKNVSNDFDELENIELSSTMNSPGALRRAEEAAAIEAGADRAKHDFLPDVKRRRRKHTKRELEQIALLEDELEDLLEQNARTEEELEWWRNQHEWQDATTHSVATRRTRLAKAEREISKRTKEGKKIREEIRARREQLQKIHESTKRSRKAIAEQQRLKALWFQYGSRKKYEEHLAWEAEKEALRQAMAEKHERKRQAKLVRQRQRAEERERLTKIKNLAALELQRLWRGRLGRNRATRRRLWLQKRARSRAELERRRAIRIQGLFRAKRDRKKVASRRSKRNAAVKLQSVARGRADRKHRVPVLRANARRKILLKCAKFRAEPSNFVRPLQLWVEQQLRKTRYAKINQSLPDFDSLIKKQFDVLRNEDEKTNSGMKTPIARQAIIFVSSTDGQTSVKYIIDKLCSQLREFLCASIDFGFKREKELEEENAIHQLAYPFRPQKRSTLQDIEYQQKIISVLSEGKSIIIPVDVGLCDMRRSAFLIEVQGFLKSVHAQRVKLRREMLSHGRMGIYDVIEGQNSSVSVKTKGYGPADLFDHVDPLVFLVCGENDLGRIGSGKYIMADSTENTENAENIDDENEDRADFMNESGVYSGEDEEENNQEDKDGVGREDDTHLTPRDRLVAASETLWKLPVNHKEISEYMQGESSIAKILSPKKRSRKSKDSEISSVTTQSQSHAEIGERTMLSLLEILDQRHGNNRLSVASAADSGTKAPSMAETIQMNEYSIEIMVLECLGIILHPSNLEDFEGPWPAYPESVNLAQKAIIATLKKILLTHQLQKLTDNSDTGHKLNAKSADDLVLLPEIKRQLQQVDLFQLSRNKKSSSALHRYSSSAKWIQFHKHYKDIPSSYLSHSSSSASDSKKPCDVFILLHKFIGEVSAFLNDINDMNSKVSHARLRGGAPSASKIFQPGPSYNDDATFDHIYVCRDKQLSNENSKRPDKSETSLEIQTPEWYTIAGEIFLSLVSGRLSNTHHKLGIKKQKKELGSLSKTRYKCLRRVPVLRLHDSLSPDAIKPTTLHEMTLSPRSPMMSHKKSSDDLCLDQQSCSLNIGIRFHRSVFQTGSGTFISAIILQLSSLDSSIPFKRILVLRENGFTTSNHCERLQSSYNINRDSDLISRLTAPHASFTGHMKHTKAYMNGWTDQLFAPKSIEQISDESSLLARLSESVCLTWDGFKTSMDLFHKQSSDSQIGKSDTPFATSDRHLSKSREDLVLSSSLLPRIVLKRKARLILSAIVRIPDIRAPSSVGQTAKCRIWEGGSGEIVLEARFVNSASDGSSSLGGVMRTFRMTWQSIRRLTSLPYFSSFMRKSDRESIELGDMKGISWFLLSRVAFDGQLLRFSCHVMDESSAPKSLKNTTSEKTQLLNTLLPIQDESTVLPLVHPLLATAYQVLIFESKSSGTSDLKVRKEGDGRNSQIVQIESATAETKGTVFKQRKARQQRLTFVAISRDNADRSVGDHRNGRVMTFWIHVMLLQPSESRGDTVDISTFESMKTGSPMKSPKKRSNPMNQSKKVHWMSLRVSHTELACASETTAVMSSAEREQFFRNPFWASETVLSAQNAGSWLEIVRLDDSEVLRRVRASQTNTSSGHSGRNTYPPNLVWVLRLKRAKLPVVQPPPKKRQNILLPMVSGAPLEIGIISKKHRSMQRGIRITTSSQRVLVYEKVDAVRKKKTKKKKKGGIMCMISVYDEGPGPPAAPSVMRIECLHPASGELVLIRVGPKGLKLVAEAEGASEKLRSGFRNDIALLLMACLRISFVKISDTKEDNMDRHFRLIFVVDGVDVATGDEELQTAYNKVDSNSNRSEKNDVEAK